MTAKMTKWYPPENKPVRAGMYKTRYGIQHRYAFWSGYAWLTSNRKYVLSNQARVWRGLAADPKGSKSNE